MKTNYFKFLCQDKSNLIVIAFSVLMHVFIFFSYQEFFSMGTGWICFFATLFDAGATAILIYVFFKWRKCQKAYQAFRKEQKGGRND